MPVREDASQPSAAAATGACPPQAAQASGPEASEDISVFPQTPVSSSEMAADHQHPSAPPESPSLPMRKRTESTGASTFVFPLRSVVNPPRDRPTPPGSPPPVQPTTTTSVVASPTFSFVPVSPGSTSSSMVPEPLQLVDGSDGPKSIHDMLAHSSSRRGNVNGNGMVSVGSAPPVRPGPKPLSRPQQNKSVRDFVDEQSRTTNMQNPNEDTPPRESPSDQASLLSDRFNELGLSGTPSDASGAQTPLEQFTTVRFQHYEDENGHHVVTGREGEITRCEDEPITSPGAIQSFGVMIVLEEDYETGVLTVRQVSENSTELLGLSPHYLFKQECFTNVLTPDQEDILRDSIEFLPDPDEAGADFDFEGPQVFRLSGNGMLGGNGKLSAQSWACWVAASRPRQPLWDKVDENGERIPPPRLIILEFELERDIFNPLFHDMDDGDMSDSENTSQSDLSWTHLTGSSPHTTTSEPPLSHNPSAERVVTESSQAKGEAATPGSASSSSRASRASAPMGLEGPEDYQPPLERILESTTNYAKPIRTLQRMRSSRRTDSSRSVDKGSSSASSKQSSYRRRRARPKASPADAVDVFAVLTQINEQLNAAQDLKTFLNITVGVVKDLSRFHRVLVYQFDKAMNGKVVTELVDLQKTDDLYKGLMFPAADIPPQARKLYLINKVRLLYDGSQPTSRLVVREKADLDYPLDMTHCYLRAMSPIHLKYLANMQVRSSMSISIVAFGKLWGLVACHSYGNHGMRVSFPVRQMLRLLSDQISRNIERLTYTKRLMSHRAMHSAGLASLASFERPSAATEKVPHESRHSAIVSNADDLLGIFEADAGVLVINDGCKLLGPSDQGHSMLAIAEYFRSGRFEDITASNNLAADFPDLNLPQAQHSTIAGVLYVPLTAIAGQDFMLFFRKGQVHTVKWAGKPYKDPEGGLKATLEPRKSFKIWTEQVTGRAAEWTPDQIESAMVLSTMYGKFIQVWRERQHSVVSNQLTAILLSNTSHALRTPLSQIINTLEMAMAGNIDRETRGMLENSHEASRALLFHVHDLLDLTRVETGNETAFNDPFDLKNTIQQTLRLYQTEAQRRGLAFNLVFADDVPPIVVGDQRKIRNAISNLVANAVKYTTEGQVEVEVRCQPLSAEDDAASNDGAQVQVEIIVTDTGCGIPPEQLQAMFVALEGAEASGANGTEGEPAAGLGGGVGLGLAVVAHIVGQLKGQLRAESEVNRGSSFYLTVTMGVFDGMKPLPSMSSDDGTAGSGGTTPRDQWNVATARLVPSWSEHGSSSQSDTPSSQTHVRMRRNNSSDTMVSGSTARSGGTARSAGSVKAVLRKDPLLNSPAAATLKLTSPEPKLSGLPKNGTGSPIPTGRVPAPATPPKPRGASNGPKSPKSALATAPPIAAEKEPEPKPARAARSSANGVMRVLVVEDDVINSAILRKRLKLDKHIVVAVEDGTEAVATLRADWDFDVVLMDIQMPIMDGKAAAREIRKFESELGLYSGETERTAKGGHPARPILVDNRIPIFAVSASLYEEDRESMMEHFDGWLLKPLDFARVRTLLTALRDPTGAKRNAEVYKKGNWERGGFLKASK